MESYLTDLELYDEYLDLFEHHVDQISEQIGCNKLMVKRVLLQRLFEEFIMLSCDSQLSAKEYMESFVEEFNVFLHNKEWNQLH